MAEADLRITHLSSKIELPDSVPWAPNRSQHCQRLGQRRMRQLGDICIGFGVLHSRAWRIHESGLLGMHLLLEIPRTHRNVKVF